MSYQHFCFYLQIETNHTVLDESLESVQDKSEEEISEKALKNFENVKSRHHDTLTTTSSNYTVDTACSSTSSGSRSSDSVRSEGASCMDHRRNSKRPGHMFSMSPCKSLKYRGKSGSIEKSRKERQEIQEALDILDSAFVDEENYI